MLYGSGPSAKQDFKTAFAQVAQACADIAPAVRLVYSPNYDPDDSVYDAWAPPPEQYQLVAVDYYPDVANQATASDVSKLAPSAECEQAAHAAMHSTSRRCAPFMITLRRTRRPR